MKKQFDFDVHVSVTMADHLQNNFGVIRDFVRPIFLKHHMPFLFYDERFIGFELGDKLAKGTDIHDLLENQLNLVKWGNGKRTCQPIKFWHIDNAGNIVEGPADGDASDTYVRYCRPYIFPAKQFLSNEEFADLITKI